MEDENLSITAYPDKYLLVCDTCGRELQKKMKQESDAVEPPKGWAMHTCSSGEFHYCPTCISMYGWDPLYRNRWVFY